MLRHLVIFLLIFCAACAPESASDQPEATPVVTVAPTESPDGVLTLAQVQQSDAPALVYSGGQLVAAWIGSDSRGVHQDARRLGVQGLSATVTLPLPPTHPYHQQLFPGDSGTTHLLWLDADQTQQTALYSALLGPNLSVIRGPVSVSEGLALDFTAVPDGSGGLWAAWSGGQVAELTLYVRRIDADGRPLLDKVVLASNAEHPALVRSADGAIWLFWLSDGQLLRQRIDQQDTKPQVLSGTISLSPGDQLIDVRAALDGTNAYFFWNITRASGLSETWWTTGTLAQTTWHQPVRLTTGVGAPLRWTVPLPDQHQNLIAAVESDEGVGIISLQSGTVTGYTLLQKDQRLIGLPSFVRDSAGDFSLGWSAATTTVANLQLLAIGK